MSQTSVVIPNWNGIHSIEACLNSLLEQSTKINIIVVENGSRDGSLELIQRKYPHIELLVHNKNLGFAGGVNSGIEKAIQNGSKYVALFNNDAVADRQWIQALVGCLDGNNKVGIATCKLTSIDNRHLDSTGDQYTNWGLPYPRGRGEPVGSQYDNDTFVFAASGGASLYRVSMLNEIGLFDKDFFAYYEDVDISFRAQLAGWKVAYVPTSIAYHQIGATSGRIKGFTTYQTMKNLPWLYWKNVPTKYLFSVGIRFSVAYFGFFFSSLQRLHAWPAFKGMFVSAVYLPKKLVQRHAIQSKRKVSPEYIWSIITHDLPPNAGQLRAIRAKLWKISKRGIF
jgi:GT2 family glycosyltransferase